MLSIKPVFKFVVMAAISLGLCLIGCESGQQKERIRNAKISTTPNGGIVAVVQSDRSAMSFTVDQFIYTSNEAEGLIYFSGNLNGKSFASTFVADYFNDFTDEIDLGDYFLTYTGRCHPEQCKRHYSSFWIINKSTQSVNQVGFMKDFTLPGQESMLSTSLIVEDSNLPNNGILDIDEMIRRLIQMAPQFD
jgi:hypothetical protein